MATQDVTRTASHRVREILQERGITQEQLAAISGIPTRTLARRLHKSNPHGTTLEELGAMASALEVPIGTLAYSPCTAGREEGGVMSEPLISASEAAATIGIKTQTLANWRQIGKGPVPVRISSNRVKYDPADVRDWIESKKGVAA